MKNKLLMFGLATVSLFTLASCGGSEDYNTVRELNVSQLDIDDEAISKLGLFYNAESSTSQKILSDHDGTDIYKLYVATDIKDSLFVYSYDLEKVFEEYGSKIKTINLNCITGTGALYETEVSGILTGLFDTNSGIKSVLDGISFKESVYEAPSLPKSISVEEEYTKYTETKDAPKLSIVYAVVYAVHVKDGQDKLRDYFIAPIYHEFTKDGNISDIKKIDSLEVYLAEGKNELKKKVEAKAE